MPNGNGSHVNGDRDNFVVLSCPSSPSSLYHSSDEVDDLAEGSAAKKARREEDPEENDNQEWGNVEAGIKEQVRKLLEFKKKDYENLLEEDRRLETAISEKKRLILANELQIEQGRKKMDARLAQFKEEEKTDKELVSKLSKGWKRMKNLQKDKERFMQEYRMEFCDAKNINHYELSREWTSLCLKKSNIESKLKRFSECEVSLAKDETRKILERFIKEKVEDVECPVCWEESVPPIFSCKEMHLICCSCLEQVLTKGNKCPVCRVRYEGNRVRHRFAEKICEELRRMRKELADLE
eukprot:GFUD01119304.1.p1 GENE.GFUD01119304.1~~GFUD01119304.1.p1  ORF type:complete len:296 (+),score=101.21 GFUD01119304.1:60-947(+)